MSHWNYRLVKKHAPIYNEYYYEIHEVHYNNDGKICLITKEPVSPYGNSASGFKWALEQMLKACDHPVLIDGQIELAPFDDEEDV